MRVVVTGATGNVGTSVLGALAQDERVTSVVGLARRAPSWSVPKAEFRAADITTDELGPHMAGADAVVHLAWAFQPTRRPLVTWRTNVLGSLRVFEAAAEAGVDAMVYSSSVGAYSPGPQDGRPVDETWPTHSTPTAAYGREKAYLERALDAFELAHPEMRVVRMRPCFLFKRDAAREQARIFAGPLFPSPLVGRLGAPVVPASRGLTFQALHTDDAAEAFLLALTRPVRGAFNLAADPPVTASELAELLSARTVPVPARLLVAGARIGFTARLMRSPPDLVKLFLSLPLLDCSRAHRELGWRPSRSGPSALASLFAGWAEGEQPPATPPLAGDRATAAR